MGDKDKLTKLHSAIHVRTSIANFLGVAESAESRQQWENRRAHIASSFGHGLKFPLHERESRQKGSVLDGENSQEADTEQKAGPSNEKSPSVQMTESYFKHQVLSAKETGRSRAASDFGMVIIKEKMMSVTQRPSKRQLGMGNLADLLHRKIRASIDKEVKTQIDDIDDYRPYFTYWVTFVQTVILVLSVIAYGFAPIGTGTTVVVGNVKMPNLAIQTENFVERDNLWIGPRQADLVHLGAKYSLCMRVDNNLLTAIDLDKKAENQSACCIRKDSSGCVQTLQQDCSEVLSFWNKWSTDGPGPDGRTSGSVCGEDPRFCDDPSSQQPFEWPDQIIKWPICEKSRSFNKSLASVKDRHMTCEIVGKPCCFGIQGQCTITTKEHCDLRRGYFHSEASLCSQINCVEELCGMMPFARPAVPDQFYRLLTSLFLHGGVVHLAFTIIFQMWIMRDIEKLLGPIRTIIIYIGSGVAGNLASCTFLPYNVEVGPSGSQFGIAACLLVEVLQSYQIYKHPHIALLRLCLPLLSLFMLGLLPWFDNWAHIFGFLFGFLLSFSFVPYVTFGFFDKRRKIMTISVCLGAAVALFSLLFIIFYNALLTDCHWCVYVNCIPFSPDFCENMAAKLKKNSTYSAFAPLTNR